MVMLEVLAAVLLFAPLGAAAISDYRHMIIPNWVSGVIALGFTAFAAAHWSTLDLQMHLVIGLVFFGVALLCWLAGWLGGGDVKLLAAVGLWLGTPFAMTFLLVLSVTSVLLAGALLVLRRLIEPTGDGLPGFLQPVARMAHSGRLAYGIPIVVAAFATLPRHFF